MFALKHQFQSYKKGISLPTCKEPLSVKLIELAVQACHTSNMAMDVCIADMIIIGYSVLYWPGKNSMSFENKPFKLLNLQIYQNNILFLTQPCELLYASDFLTLAFDTYKNGVTE